MPYLSFQSSFGQFQRRNVSEDEYFSTNKVQSHALHVAHALVSTSAAIPVVLNSIHKWQLACMWHSTEHIQHKITILINNWQSLNSKQMLSVSQQQYRGTCLKQLTSSTTIENLSTASVVNFSVTIQCTCLKELAPSSTTIENHSTASVVSFSVTIQWNLLKGMQLLINNNWESLNSKCCQFLSNNTMEPA